MPVTNHESRIPAPYRGRFAPSPTGPLHFGSLVAAVGSWLCARAAGGAWLVRVEDIDPPREMPGASQDILATLAAFGMESDEPVLFQSTRHDAHAAVFERLREAGHVFPCRCSRTVLAARGGIHGPACASAGASARGRAHAEVGASSHGQEGIAWRLGVPDEIVRFEDGVQGEFAQQLSRDVGAFVVKRVEGWFAYQLAVVVDDAAQGITEIVRGADLLDSTPRQIWLQTLLGSPTPHYRHLPLALDSAGRKLSKQDKARPVDRDAPLPALRAALRFLGLTNIDLAAGTPQALLQRALTDFDPQRIPSRAAATELA